MQMARRTSRCLRCTAKWQTTETGRVCSLAPLLHHSPYVEDYSLSTTLAHWSLSRHPEVYALDPTHEVPAVNPDNLQHVDVFK